MNAFSRTSRLRLRRQMRRHTRHAETHLQQVEEKFESDVINRLEHLVEARRFVFGWLLLATVMVGLTVLQSLNLSGLYQQFRPSVGGSYNEGMIGTYSGANPIFATGLVDTAASKLLFAGLLTYDENNQLVGDLAEKYEASETGQAYTVFLRSGLTWHDGKPITADDVVYTFSLIQNPDVKSPLFASWQGITVTKLTPLSVRFTLPGTLASFPHSLTTGILPKHRISKIPPKELRSNTFNTTNPIGSGPYMWQALQLSSATEAGRSTGILSLEAFPAFHAGRANIDHFYIHTYENEQQLLTAYADRTINAIAGLKNIPSAISEDTGSVVLSYRTTAATMVFLKNDGVLADNTVRKALSLATNRDSIIKQLDSRFVALKTPLLPGQVGFDRVYAQPAPSLEQAKQLLQTDGWEVGKNGIRVKDKKPLSIRLYAEDTLDNQVVARELAKQWKAAGVYLIPVLQQNTDFQVTVQVHSYEALLQGISIGADPDVFAYWHSSQADVRLQSRLNFSEYKSSVTDAALEAGRTRTDPVSRALKYKPFLKAWQEDTPAIPLYEPTINYVTRGQVIGQKAHRINIETDRYNDVYKWAVTLKQSTK